MSTSDDLDRFVAAQDDGGAYDRALAELRRGRKTSHWMWFVLPQLTGLGHSAMAVRYGIAGLGEARAYLAHPVLRPRLDACVDALLDLPETTAIDVLGEVDAQKLRSSMTLFEAADPGHTTCADVLDRWFDGRRDPATLTLLDQQPAQPDGSASHGGDPGTVRP